MQTLNVIHEVSEARHLAGLQWEPSELLAWIYGEECEFTIRRRDVINEWKEVFVTCSDGSSLKFGLHGHDVKYVLAH